MNNRERERIGVEGRKSCVNEAERICWEARAYKTLHKNNSNLYLNPSTIELEDLLCYVHVIIVNHLRLLC